MLPKGRVLRRFTGVLAPLDNGALYVNWCGAFGLVATIWTIVAGGT